MERSKKIFYKACSFIPTAILKKLAPGASLLPYHHIVSDQEVPHVRHLYPYKNVRQFEKDLDHLLKHLRPAGVEEITKAFLSGGETPRGSFLLTFDDGFREVYDVIAPILSSKGVPAVFFVNPAFLDNRILFYRCKISLVIEELLRKRDQASLIKECASLLGDGLPGSLPVDGAPASLDEMIRRIRKIDNLHQDLLDKLASRLELSFDEYLRVNRPFLTVSQTKELGNRGFCIGAHSWDHPYYDLIPEEEQVTQTVRSANYVNENFSPSGRLFSFPHSDVSLPQHFFDCLCAMHAPIDVFFGIQNQKEEASNRMLHRFNAERPDLPMSGQLNGVLLWMLIQKLRGRQSVKRI